MLGFVQRLYRVDSNIVDIMPVPAMECVRLARSLGIDGSTESFMINRMLREVEREQFEGVQDVDDIVEENVVEDETVNEMESAPLQHQAL